jgi:hypothetical protein
MFAPAAPAVSTTSTSGSAAWPSGRPPSAVCSGSTFNFVFEKQLEDLQNGDRFYYLQRLDGVALRFQLEGNSLVELARRNTDFRAGCPTSSRPRTSTSMSRV